MLASEKVAMKAHGCSFSQLKSRHTVLPHPGVGQNGMKKKPRDLMITYTNKGQNRAHFNRSIIQVRPRMIALFGSSNQDTINQETNVVSA